MWLDPELETWRVVRPAVLPHKALSLPHFTSRQKIERYSSAGFPVSDFSEFDEIEPTDEEGENAVEKGGLYVAGNIAGAKGQQVRDGLDEEGETQL